VGVVFPLAGLNVSGGVKNLLLQATALAEAGHKVLLLVPDFSAAPSFPLSARVCVRRLATGPRNAPRWLRQLTYYVRLALTATQDADLCVVAYYPTVYCAVVSRVLNRARTKILYSVAAYEPFTHGLAAESRLPMRVVRAALAWLSYRLPVDRVYASHWLRDQVGDPGGVVIGRGVDTRVFTPAGRRTSTSDEKPLRIGTIGRSGRVKGYADFAAAVAGMTGVEVLVLALDPVALPAGVPSRRLPPTDEAGMAEFYRACDVFVFTSLSEGFPAPPLEAMACGCAVITTDCGGVREYARHESNCLIVPPSDPVALRGALDRLCRDAPLRACLTVNGVSSAARFDRQHMLDLFAVLATT